jgi:hypothetical protein
MTTNPTSASFCDLCSSEEANVYSDQNNRLLDKVTKEVAKATLTSLALQISLLFMMMTNNCSSSDDDCNRSFKHFDDGLDDTVYTSMFISLGILVTAVYVNCTGSCYSRCQYASHPELRR